MEVKNFDEIYSKYFESNLFTNTLTHQYFGKTKHTFSQERLRLILNDDATKATGGTDDFSVTKIYLLTYFAKSTMSTTTIFCYEPTEDGRYIISSDGAEILKGCSKISVKYFLNSRVFVFNPVKWFYNEVNTTFKILCDPRQPLFHSSKVTGQNFINITQGFLHKNIKPFESYSEATKKGVDKILKHIKNVWCSNNKTQYNYVLNWLACAVTGHKMHTALFLKSGEGTGKSIIVEFFIKCVIGYELGLITSRSRQLLGFNSLLLDKILVCLEELPSANKSEWHSLSDFLKDLITGGKIDIEKKYQDMIQIINYISLIVITNNENTIKFGKDIRRYFMADISHDYVGNDKYFEELSRCCDSAEIGEAMFMFMLEHYEKIKDTFKENVIPEKLSKLEMKDRNCTSIIDFVKSKFVKKGYGIFDREHKKLFTKVTNLMDYFNHEMNLKIGTRAFIQLIKGEIPILKTVQFGKKKELYFTPCSWKKLKTFFEKKGYWNDLYDQLDCEEENIYHIEDQEEIEEENIYHIEDQEEIESKNKKLLKDMIQLHEKIMKETPEKTKKIMETFDDIQHKYKDFKNCMKAREDFDKKDTISTQTISINFMEF